MVIGLILLGILGGGMIAGGVATVWQSTKRGEPYYPGKDMFEDLGDVLPDPGTLGVVAIAGIALLGLFMLRRK